MSEEDLIKKIHESEEKTLEMGEVIERKKGRPKKENPNLIVPVSMPPEIKAQIDNDEEGKINRSKLVCKALIFYFANRQ